eukprot:COSAG06_NODE_37914_length_429_cov_1.481818_1_plen_72_part_10
MKRHRTLDLIYSDLARIKATIFARLSLRSNQIQIQDLNNAPPNELGVDRENTRGNLQLKKRFSGAFQAGLGV